jgi:protein dithiol:quinone oxidoreductase
MTGSSRGLLAGIAGLSLAAVAAALVSQHVFDMQPCPWCVLQRLIFAAIAIVALAGLAWRSAVGRRAVGGTLLMLSSAGVAAVLWQHFVAASSTSCNLTFADRLMNASGLPTLLPDVFEARATCADAAVRLMGLPYEFWGLALFVAIAAASIVALAQARRG